MSNVQKAIAKRESARSKPVTPVPSEQSEKVGQLDDSLKAAQTKTNEAYKGKKSSEPEK